MILSQIVNLMDCDFEVIDTKTEECITDIMEAYDLAAQRIDAGHEVVFIYVNVPQDFCFEHNRFREVVSKSSNALWFDRLRKDYIVICDDDDPNVQTCDVRLALEAESDEEAEKCFMNWLSAQS